MFTKHCFSYLLCFFHLVNNKGLPDPGELDYNPCARYQPLVDNVNRVFRHHHSPHQEISVESLVGTKNKTSLMQYLPNKHHHFWGIKFLMMCDCVQLLPGIFHIQRGQVSGRQGQHPKERPGVHHHEKLLEIGRYLNKSYHVFVNSYFMSVPLVCHLHQLSTHITGTVRRSGKLLPE
jgi:hypothetical protein